MNSELTRRVAFTLGALLVYRIGTYIPLPGVDLSVWMRLFHANESGALGALSGQTGGSIAHLALFSLSLTPLFSAAVLIQILYIVSARFRRFARSGEHGRAAVVRTTFILAVVLAVFQAYGVAVGLENVRGLVDQPGPLFRLSTVLTLTGGTVLLIWLCNQITLRGVGNGIAWILFLGIVMAIPGTPVAVGELVRTGAISERGALALLALAIAAVAFVVCVERARRFLEVQFAGRQIGERALEPRLSQLSLKLNSAGVVPAVVMLWLLPVLLTLSALAAGEDAGWVERLADALVPGRPGFLIYLIGGILIVAFIYTAFMIDPDDAAERLKRYGGVLPGVAPGEPTATAIDQVLTRVTMMGAVYLALVFVVPMLLISYAGLPFYFGGASLLILVCVVLDIEAQVRGHKNIEQGGLRA